MICWVARNERSTRRRPVACLGVTMAPGGASWLRLAALSDGVAPSVLEQLWDRTEASLQARNAWPVAALGLERWIEPHLRSWGFAQTNDVITLCHRGKHHSQPPLVTVRLRDASHHDLPAIARVDEAAFESLWRHDEADLAHAQVAAVIFVVAELEGNIVGYQLSTQHGLNGHLARLAVDPGVQGQGIGRGLVSSALTFFEQRGIREVTVNTQRDNLASQRLYRRTGFESTNHSVPVWTLDRRRSE
jgi:ribosomal-protein-alanine N-acetyltransferase